MRFVHTAVFYSIKNVNERKYQQVRLKIYYV